MKVVKSTATSATSHIVPDGWTNKTELYASCGTKLKRTHNTSIKQQGQVTCIACINAYIAKKRS